MATSIPVTGPVLKKGSSGPAVEQWQKWLQERKFFPGGTYGFFGDVTVASTRAYQKSVGLPQSGELDQVTRAKASGASVCAPSSPPEDGGFAPAPAPGPGPAPSGVKPSMVQPGTHKFGREAILKAWARIWPNEQPTLGALQIAGGVSTLEGAYGKGCYRRFAKGPDGKPVIGPNGQKVVEEKNCTTNNFGAIQGNAVGNGKTGGFMASDFDSVTGKWFQAHYQTYATPEDGAEHLLHLLDLYAGDAMRKGDIDAFSRAMYIGAHRGGTIDDPRGYYGGVNVLAGKTGEARRAAAEKNVSDHATKVANEAYWVSQAMGEPLVAKRGGAGGGGGPIARQGGGEFDDETMLGAGLIGLGLFVAGPIGWVMMGAGAALVTGLVDL